MTSEANTGTPPAAAADQSPRTTVRGELDIEMTDTGDQFVYYLGGTNTSWRELGREVTGPDGDAVAVTSYCPAVHAA